MRMHKIILIVLTLFCLFRPVDVLATYRIHLKNNSRFLTCYYWEKSGVIFFNAFGGTVGFEKAFIKKIEETDTTLEELPFPPPAVVPPPPKNTPTLAAKPPATPQESQTAKKAFMPEFQKLQKRFEVVENLNAADLLQLARDLMQFRDKVLAHRKGHLYSDQFAALYQMGDRIEALHKSLN